MNQEQSQALGALIRARRLELGYTTYQLGAAAGVQNSTVVRIEQGKFAAPRPDKLAKFAQHLGMSVADLFGRAGYLVPHELPTFGTYLLTKYPDLPEMAMAELQSVFEKLTALHGIEIFPLAPAVVVSNDAPGGVQ
jgi:transcriptional regulator with XRE-family HTH domain